LNRLPVWPIASVNCVTHSVVILTSATKVQRYCVYSMDELRTNERTHVYPSTVLCVLFLSLINFNMFLLKLSKNFRRVCKISKSDYQLRLVCLSTWDNSAPTAGRIWVFLK